MSLLIIKLRSALNPVNKVWKLCFQRWCSLWPPLSAVVDSKEEGSHKLPFPSDKWKRERKGEKEKKNKKVTLSFTKILSKSNPDFYFIGGEMPSYFFLIFSYDFHLRNKMCEPCGKISVKLAKFFNFFAPKYFRNLKRKLVKILSEMCSYHQFFQRSPLPADLLLLWGVPSRPPSQNHQIASSQAVSGSTTVRSYVLK